MPVTIARLLLGIVSTCHLLLVAFTLTHLHTATTAVTIALAVYIPLFPLTGFLAVALSTGHPWTLRPATVSQAFGIACSSISTPPVDALQPFIPLFVAIGVAILVVLWGPTSSRAFFRGHPRSRSSRRPVGRGRTTADP